MPFGHHTVGSSSSRGPHGQVYTVRTEHDPIAAISVGVEVEILLRPVKTRKRFKNTQEFANAVTEEYNYELQHRAAGHFPSMRNVINQPVEREDRKKWVLDQDHSIHVPNRSLSYGIELISPVLRVHHGSEWTEQMSFLWHHFDGTVVVDANDSCGTHVHISVDGNGYSLWDLQRIACAVLHFEPAFEAALPNARRRNMYAKSNWIDNPNFGHKKLSRRQAMDLVAGTSSIDELIWLMNPPSEDSPQIPDRYYGWNFTNLQAGRIATIEFRRGAASTGFDHVMLWIQVAMSFVQAAMRRGTRDFLGRFPPTAEGLRQFIESAYLPPELYDPLAIQRFTRGCGPNAFLEPKPLGRLSKEQRNMLMLKKKQDRERNVMLIKTLSNPYWS